MKRKTLSVIGVLMAVLMALTALAACEKAPAEADSNGGNSESVSTEQGGELYEFAASDEAAAKVRSMAEVLGGYDFESLSGVQSTWLLEQAIYDDIAAAGEKISGHDGYKISGTALSELLESRFGVKYSGGDKEIYYDGYAREWTAKAVRLEELDGEKATYSVELESKYLDFPCRCEMAFEVEKRGEKYALQLASSRFTSGCMAPSPEQQAEYLTERLVEILGADAVKNGTAPEDFSAEAFLAKVAATSFEGRGFDPKTPYRRAFYRSTDGLWRFPAEEARRIVREVFGTEFSGFDGYFDFTYDADADEYVSGLEFGSEGAYSCQDVSVAPVASGYEVSFVLVSSTAFEGGEVYGEYVAGFSYESENGLDFLRLKGITPVDK